MRKPCIKKSLYISQDNIGNLIFHLNSKNVCKISINIDFIKKLVLLMDGTYTEKELLEKIRKEGYDISQKSLEYILKMFDERNFLDEYEVFDSCGLSQEELKKYDRQINSFALNGKIRYQDAIKMQSVIKRKKICVIGVGGVGSHSLYGFAAMGIGKITAVDFDKIELSNTSRQMLYWESDIGKYKVDVAKEKMLKINPRVDYEFINKKISSVEDVVKVAKNSDMIYLCADTPRGKIIDIVDEAALLLRVPYYVGSPTNDQILCGPLILPNSDIRYRSLIGNHLIHEDKDIEKIKEKVINNQTARQRLFSRFFEARCRTSLPTLSCLAYFIYGGNCLWQKTKLKSMSQRYLTANWTLRTFS